MKSNRRGFTLIEVLVVVLIIAILAAIALPQYQKAVEKSRATEALTIGNTLKRAQQLRHLETGEWDGINKDVLEIEVSGGEWDAVHGVYYTKNFRYSIEDGDFVNVNRCQNPKTCNAPQNIYSLAFYADEEGYGPNLCVDEDTSTGQYICNWLSTAHGFSYTPNEE